MVIKVFVLVFVAARSSSVLELKLLKTRNGVSMARDGWIGKVRGLLDPINRQWQEGVV